MVLLSILWSLVVVQVVVIVVPVTDLVVVEVLGD
jgi:hypothetical protein